MADPSRGGEGQTDAVVRSLQAPRAGSGADAADEIITPRLAQLIQREGEVRVGHDGRLYRYDRGRYRNDGDTWVRVRVRERLGDRYRRRVSDDVVAWCRANFPTIAQTPPCDVLNVANGLLRWQVAELRPHDPQVATTVQLPVEWSPEASCPRIEAFLRDVLPPDALDFVVELMGYAMYAGNPMRVAVLLLGSGRNGKSVLLSVVTALLGADNVSAIPLQVLAENRFASAELFGKLANISGDLDARAIRRSDVFKTLTGGDPIHAERKYAAPFTFRPFALPIFSANEAPISSDQSAAWFDRWLIVPFERRIPDERVDPHLAAKLTHPDELAGLLVLAVEGLRRLMARGCFDPPASVRRAGDRYRDRLDTVRAFVAEECVVAPDAWVARPQLYRAYVTWAKEGGRLPLSAPTFNEHLDANLGGRIEQRTRRGDRGWAGIGLLADGRDVGGDS